ncbi:hypothetical protein ACFRFU_49985 [Streptomyces sp. NPDC056704]
MTTAIGSHPPWMGKPTKTPGPCAQEVYDMLWFCLREAEDMTGRGYPVETMFGYDRPRGYLLHCEQDRYTPTQAMQRADRVVIEANSGGDYLPALFEQVDPTVNWHETTVTTRSTMPMISR